MKKIILAFVATLSILVFTLPVRVLAVESLNPQNITADNHTAREEAEGKGIWEKLQAKQLECKNLIDNNFESLGEYSMGQMVGSSHEAMNNMMEKMMGKEGEEQMHVVMGKRLSGCDTSAQIPSQGLGFMPMMGMIMGMMGGGGNPMMGGFGLLGWLSMIVFWALLILGVVALFRYLGGSGKTAKDDKTPLEILKERYARGEIDKKEFAQMKKELSS